MKEHPKLLRVLARSAMCPQSDILGLVQHIHIAVHDGFWLVPRAPDYLNGWVDDEEEASM